MKLYDDLGQDVRTLVDDDLQTGTHSIRLDSKDVASGIYYYRIIAGSFTATKRMILLK